MNEFKINEYLTLKLERGSTVIYVKGERFDQCKFLLLDIPVKEVTSLDEIKSIDEASEKLDRSMEDTEKQFQIPPESEFWGHCSNLHVWAENNYDTRLLHSNLAFPLIKELTNVGDPIANKVFKEEIAKRIKSGYTPVIQYLYFEGYLNNFTVEEFEAFGIIPDDADLWNEMGEYYYENSDYDVTKAERDDLDNNKAIAWFKRAIMIDPEHINAWSNLGLAYGDEGEYNKANECYEKLKELEPNDADPWYELGEINNEKELYDKAIECYKKATEHVKEDIKHWEFFKELNLTTEEFLKFFYKTFEYSEVIPFIDDEAPIYMKKLNQVHDLFILSALDSNYRYTLIKQLEFYNVKQPIHYKDMIIVPETPYNLKLKKEFEIYVDDNPHLVEPIKHLKDKYLLLFNQPWNQESICEQNVIRVNNWMEIYEIIQNL